MSTRTWHRLLLVLLGLVATSSVVAQEWTRFRGPNGTGESECKTIPAQWTDKEILWKTELPGAGHSSPVLWGDKLFIFSADPKDATRYCLCYNATNGKELWRVTFPSLTHRLHQFSSYGSSTPTVDEQRVYFAWSDPQETTLLALDHDGNQVWKNNLGPWVSQHGFGTSPILYGDMLILNNAQDDEVSKEAPVPGKSFMMAFDRKTGKELWRTPIKSKSVSYSVPFIRELPNGKAEVVCSNTGDGLYGIDVATGHRNWSSPGTIPMRTVSSPIMAAGLVFGSCGSGAYADNVVVAVRPGEGASVAYELKNSSKIKAPYVPCLVKRDNLLFLLYDRGYASCVDAATGAIHWFERTNAAFMGSPVRVDDKIYCMDQDGVVWVFAAEKEYKLLAQNPLGETSRSTPAVANGRMFLRTLSHLTCVGQATGE
ncbi:MAG: PQQ-binding-like beta-propeller repeat protein [Pirellulaceae bacterium]